MSGPDARADFDPFRVGLNGPCLVEASAGTGKTHAIGSLVLRLLAQGADDGRPPPTIDQILVVTFTNAATAELRGRIRRRMVSAVRLLAALEDPAQSPSTSDDPADSDLRAWLVGLPPAERQAADRRLRIALRDYDDAAVFTIHGFCQRTLRDFAFESRMDFDAELVPDDAELRRTAIHDYWASMAYDADPVALRWVTGVGKLGVTGMEILGDVLARTSRLERMPAVEGTAPARGAEPPPMDVLASWRRHWQALAQSWRDGGDEALRLLAAAAAAKAINNTSYKADVITGAWRPRLARALGGEPPGSLEGDLRTILEGLTSTQIAAKTNKAKEPPQHPFFEACEALLAAWAETEAALGDWGLALRHGLAEWLAQELPARRRRAHQLSFDDLLHRLDEALRSPTAGRRLALRIKGRFRAALIDEFQDTDQLQDRIFRAIFNPEDGDGDAAPFLRIGDPKQAIYAFRGADVFAYLGAVQGLPPGARHSLAVNHRSDRGMVDALNALWQPAVRPFLFQGIRYQPATARHGDRLQPAGAALDLAYLPAAVADRRVGAGGKAVNKDKAQRAAARAAAIAVARLLQNPPLIEGHRGFVKRAGAGDVAVLVRTNAQARLMQRALRALGVPTALLSAASVLDQPEVKVMLRLLAALLDPADAWVLRSALVAPPFSLGAEDIDLLAEDEADWEAWVERFRDWQATWRRQGFLPAFRQLLDQEKGAARLLAQSAGERRLTNLLHLAELLHGAAARQELGPEGLKSWLERAMDDQALRSQTLGDTSQLRLERDAEAVKLVTIHRSKGLEYPFVFCPFLWSDAPSPKASDAKPIAYHDMDGDQQLRLDIAAVHSAVATQSAGLEALAEHLRLLYVALTRARHRCWLAWGPFNDTEDSALAYLFFSDDCAGQAPEGDAARDLAAWRARVAAAAKAAIHAAAAADDAVADPLWAKLKALADSEPGLVRARYLSADDLRQERQVGFVAGGAAAPAEPAGGARRPLHTPRRVLVRSSFTALTRGDTIAGVNDPADDNDRDALTPAEAAELAEAVAAPSPDEKERIPLADMVAGARLGTGLHALLERVDFQGDAAQWRPVAERLVARRALPATALEPLLDVLPAILHTPLGTGNLGFRLADIAWADRRDEMGYILPVVLQTQEGRFRPLVAGHGVQMADLADLLEQHSGGAVPTDYPRRLRGLPAPRLSGWLSGSLDLVFRRGAGGDARWFLLDWKSNRLGDRWADYAPERLTAAMSGHHYFLQAHLYALALHRHLTARLPDYRYERHFGGVLYVFVRGVRDGVPGSGVCFDRPPEARILAMDRLLKAGRP